MKAACWAITLVKFGALCQAHVLSVISRSARLGRRREQDLDPCSFLGGARS